MASKAAPHKQPRSMFAPTILDYILAAGALAVLGVVLAAVLRGQAEWHLLPWVVWLHLAAIIGALALTPAMLIRRKGDRRHRQLGYVWVGLMVGTALGSFFIRLVNIGTFSPIHLLSVFTLFMCVRLVRAARRHDVRGHLSAIRGIVIGALLIAGFFTFPFGRLLGMWLRGLATLA